MLPAARPSPVPPPLGWLGLLGLAFSLNDASYERKIK